MSAKMRFFSMAPIQGKNAWGCSNGAYQFLITQETSFYVASYKECDHRERPATFLNQLYASLRAAEMGCRRKLKELSN